MNSSRKAKRREDPVEIGDHVKTLVLEGVRKAGTQRELAQVLGYLTPTNIIYQFLSAPKYKRTINASRLKTLKEFLGGSSTREKDSREG